MRLVALLLAAFSLALPTVALADSGSLSSIHVLHPAVKPGQAQTVTIDAFDLQGAPLTGASAVVTVKYPSVTHRYHLTYTDVDGTTSVTFHVPPHIPSSRATVEGVVSNGYLEIPVSTSFSVGSGATATSLVVIARALPSSVSASQPVWVAVYARTRSGVDAAGARVSGTAYFKEGARHVTGTMDRTGLATLRVDTRGVRANETVRLTATVTWKSMKGSVSTTFAVRSRAPVAALPPTPTPTLTSTPTPQPLPTPTSLPTWTPVPTPTPLSPGQTSPVAMSTATDTPTDTATLQSAATPTYTLTATATPTAQPAPTNTSVPTPTATAALTPTPTPTATSTPAPTPTPTLVPDCPGSQSACMQAVLDMLNNTRASAGVSPLTLNMTQSNGTATCVGSIGHSQAMADSGSIWHTNPAYPQASDWNDLCVPISEDGANVGTFSSGNELQDLRGIHQLFMNEEHDAAYCAQLAAAGYSNHACTILDRRYSQVGIGIVYQNGSTWLTEDFIG